LDAIPFYDLISILSRFLLLQQLNYFGFKKIAGKGKMSPCSYINDMATSDIRSLLLIKRKPAKASADDESLPSSENGKSVASSSSAGKKRSSLPDSNAISILNQPISVMAAGPALALCNNMPSLSSNIGAKFDAQGSQTLAMPNQPMPMMGIGSAPTLGNMQPLGGNIKRAKVDFCADNHYIKVTDNNSLGIVAKNVSNDNKSLPLAAQHHNESLLNAYNMAIGNPQITNFVNQNSSNGTVISNNTSSYGAPSSENSASTIGTSSVANNNASLNSYLCHKSSQHALSVPAPMQFLDPSELGMSIENSLNELKNNFKAANQARAIAFMPSYSQTALTNGCVENKRVMSTTGSEPSTENTAAADEFDFQASSASTAPKMQAMLSRDDSLINLAMLPNLLSSQDLSSYNPSFFGSHMNDENNGGFLQRNDSLIELAASVENTNANTGNIEGSNDDENDADLFSFLDFQGQM
jgi:hypothetical protein